MLLLLINLLRISSKRLNLVIGLLFESSQRVTFLEKKVEGDNHIESISTVEVVLHLVAVIYIKP